MGKRPESIVERLREKLLGKGIDVNGLFRRKRERPNLGTRGIMEQQIIRRDIDQIKTLIRSDFPEFSGDIEELAFDIRILRVRLQRGNYSNISNKTMLDKIIEKIQAGTSSNKAAAEVLIDSILQANERGLLSEYSQRIIKDGLLENFIRISFETDRDNLRDKLNNLFPFSDYLRRRYREQRLRQEPKETIEIFFEQKGRLLKSLISFSLSEDPPESLLKLIDRSIGWKEDFIREIKEKPGALALDDMTAVRYLSSLEHNPFEEAEIESLRSNIETIEALRIFRLHVTAAAAEIRRRVIAIRFPFIEDLLRSFHAGTLDRDFPKIIDSILGSRYLTESLMSGRGLSKSPIESLDLDIFSAANYGKTMIKNLKDKYGCQHLEDEEALAFVEKQDRSKSQLADLELFRYALACFKAGKEFREYVEANSDEIRRKIAQAENK